jgi:calpain-15
MFLDIEWQTPVQVFGRDYKVFEGKIEPLDILQGSLGDCYFLAALAGLAEHQDRIKRIFPIHDTNEAGVYMVSMYIMGMKMNILLDDYIPCGDRGKVIFSAANGSELWVILAEKAFAKMFRTYENIIAGDPTEALRILTGAPSFTITHKQNPNVFD